MKDLYKIVGHVYERFFEMNPNKDKEHPVDIDSSWVAYINRIEEKKREHKMEDHIIVEPNPDGVLIPEKSVYYKTRCKITIKNLTISVSAPKQEMYFYPPASSAQVDNGIYLIFENNNFIGKTQQCLLDFYLQGSAYFVFKNNKFKSVDGQLFTDGAAKIEFKNNLFEDSDLSVKKSNPSNAASLDIICLDNNIFYRKDKRPSRLETDIDSYFKGKNTVDNLILNGNLLHWGGLQNIDPHGEHAHTHKPIFTKFMKAATEKMTKCRKPNCARSG